MKETDQLKKLMESIDGTYTPVAEANSMATGDSDIRRAAWEAAKIVTRVSNETNEELGQDFITYFNHFMDGSR